MQFIVQKCCLIIFMAALLGACRTPRYVYTPNTVNVPVFNQKGQGMAQASYGSSKINNTSGHARGGDFLGAYSFHKHLGVQGRYSFRNEKDQYVLKNEFVLPVPDSFGTSSVSYKRHEAELGAGGFLPLNRSKSIVMHVWGGMGTGSTAMKEQNEVAGINYQRNLRYNTFRLYWQPHVSFVPSPYFNISYFFKFSRIYFKNVSTDMNEAELMPRMLNNLSAKSLPITEGGYSLNFGFRGMEGFRIQQQTSLAGSHGDRSVRGLNISLGLQYNFGNTIDLKMDRLKNPSDRYRW